VSRRKSILALCLVSALSAPAAAGAPKCYDPEWAARDAYKQGVARYELGDFDQALALFKHAYALTRSPLLLFNIAQTYRLSRDYTRAADTYRDYLRVLPAAPNRGDVEELILETRARVDGPAPAPRVDGPAPAPRVMPEASPPAVRDDPRPERRARAELIAGAALAAAGVAALATAGYFAARRQEDFDRVTAAGRSGGAWDARVQAAYSDGPTAATTANVLFAVGGVLGASGAVLAIVGAVGRARARNHRALALVPLGAGAAAVWRCEF
jgi:tetratricopeptide (TPR) repeat protein